MKRYRRLFLTKGIQLLLTLVFALTATSLYVSYAEPEDRKIPDNVFVGDIDASGMTKDELQQAVSERIDELGNVTLTLSSPNNEVNVSLLELGLYWSNEREVYDLAFASENQGSLIVQYKYRKDMESSNMKFSVETRIDKNLLANFLLEHNSELNNEAKNATVERVGGRFVVTDGVPGMVMNMDETYDAIVAAVLKLEATELTNQRLVVEVVGEETQPQVMADAYENFGDLLGECTTTYSTKDAGRTVNVTLASSKFNGVVVMPGETISALEIMAPVTEAGGYKAAGTYTPGGVEDQIGGGICQVATTLYDAALWAELDFPLRKNHSRIVSYVPYAMDAMVYAKGNSDFKLTNNKEYPIYIESFVDNSKATGYLTFRIYGVETRPANRTIEYESVLVDYTVPEKGADPSEYFDLQYDDTMVPYGKAQEGDVYAEQLSGFYPLVKAELYKIVYIDGVQQSRTKVNTSNYTNSGLKRIIKGTFLVHPDTYIKNIVYDIKDPNNMLIEWGYRKPEATTEAPTTEEETESPTTEPAPTDPPETSTEAPTEPPTEAPTEPPTEAAPTEAPGEEVSAGDL